MAEHQRRERAARAERAERTKAGKRNARKREAARAELARRQDAALREAFAAEAVHLATTTPLRRQRAAVDAQLRALGAPSMAAVHTDPRTGASVRLPDPPADLNERLFTRRDDEWVALAGLLAAQTLAGPQGSRRERALALARRNALTPDEEAHLGYLADAQRPVDLVTVETIPLSKQDAREALAALDQARTAGVRPPRPNLVEGWKQ